MISKQMVAWGESGSSIREIAAYGERRAAEIGPENVYNFAIGNPSIDPPDCVQEAVERLLHTVPPTQLHAYSPDQGLPEVRRAVAEYLNGAFSMTYAPEDIYMTSGASAGLAIGCRALLSPGDECITLTPYFSEYRTYTEAAGGVMREVPSEPETFQLDYEAFAAAVNGKTWLVILNSPNNPSGVVYTEETLKGLAALLERKSAEYGHPIYIIADEPYRELVYGGVKVPFIPCLYRNTIVCYSYSKSLSLPGERIGYVYVPGFADDSAAVYAAISGAARIMGHVCPPTLMQKVIELCAGERPDLAAYEENRNLLYNSLREMGYQCAKPDGAFYLFVKAPNGDANAFSERAKLTHNLLVVPADGFGCPGYFRLSYCVSNDMIRRSLPAFKAMIESYK